MKQFKSYLTVVATTIVLASCGVNDLEDRLDKVEGALGTNEPLKADFSTTNGDNVVIAVKKNFLFKPGGDNEYIYDNEDGTYDVYIERLSDIEWYESASIEFTYNPETKEITDRETSIYFYNQFGGGDSYWFYDYEDGNTDGITIDITVNSFNAETGKIKVNAVSTTTSDYDYNEYDGKAMNLSLSFAGTLPVFSNGGPK